MKELDTYGEKPQRGSRRRLVPLFLAAFSVFLLLAGLYLVLFGDIGTH